MVREFRDFLMRGNIVDLAVAVVIGAAFGAVVTSLTDDLLMPIIGIFGGHRTSRPTRLQSTAASSAGATS